MFPDFLGMNVDEIHLEMASREFAEIEIVAEISNIKDVAVGIVDVKTITSKRRKSLRGQCSSARSNLLLMVGIASSGRTPSSQ
jgi:hypothetical protein